MDVGVLDDMIAMASIELATAKPGQVAMIVRTMITEWQNQPALAICFAMTSAAASLSEQFEDQDGVVAQTYLMSSLLAADIFAVEQMGQQPAKGSHLLVFWRRVDPQFAGQ